MSLKRGKQQENGITIILRLKSNDVTFSDCDFLSAATEYLQLSIKDALESENYLIKVFAIMDRRVGKRTLEKIRNANLYKEYPEWVQQFYRLRMEKDK